MDLTRDEQALVNAAITFAQKNKKQIARKLTSKAIYLPEADPVSVFMAGSPGAGKTEASLELIEHIGDGAQVLRIDPDDLRCYFSGYTGQNSYLFQGGVSILVEKIHDLALKQHQSFLLDGTLSNYEKAAANIGRSLDRGRLVQILYVYQDPILAWQFVKARELVEGRRILKKNFIGQYFAARDSVNRLKAQFKQKIIVDLLLKDMDNGHRAYEANIDRVDNHVPEKYTPATLEQLLQ